MPTPFSQRDPHWSGIRLGTTGHTVGLFGCLLTAVIFDINREINRNDNPGMFANWLDAHAGFDAVGQFRWDKVSEYTRGRLRYLGTGLAAKLRKKYTIQQVDFGPIGHFVALLPGNKAFDPWQGRVTKIVKGAIEID